MPATTSIPVAIVMGSQSDWATMKHAAETLKALGIGHEAKIVSAHQHARSGFIPSPNRLRKRASKSSLQAPAGRHICPA